jgi:hypothetical protein
VLAASVVSASALTSDWVLIGWNDLGMHCMDGNEQNRRHW